MWRLKIAAGGNPWLRTTNNHVWEFDPKLTLSHEEVSEIENARQSFTKNRFQYKHSADLITRFQFELENPVREVLPQVKLKESGEVTEEAVTTTLRRALNFYSTIHADDGHWPGDYGGPMFAWFDEHKKEMIQYLYIHQRIALAYLIVAMMETFYQGCTNQGSTTWPAFDIQTINV